MEDDETISSGGIENEASNQEDKSLSSFYAIDCIMEPDISSKMKEYLAHNGQPAVIVKLLSEHYRGLGQMCNLLIHWLRTSGVEENEIDQLIEQYIKEQILENFDPKKADTIFSEGQAAPEWLEYMIKQPKWRVVLYQLAETYKNCLLLNYSIQKISDEGHQIEIASLTTASTFFDVFNKILKESIENLYKVDEQSFSETLNDFKRVCCHSEQTYTYTQFLLHRLIKGKNGYFLKRLSQELQNEVIHKGALVQSMELSWGTTQQEIYLSKIISQMISAGSTNPSDIQKLYLAYFPEITVSIELLRQPHLFELLIKDLFTPNKNINQTYKSKYFCVLAAAATYPSNKEKKEEVQKVVQALEKIHEICYSNPTGSELQGLVVSIKKFLNIPVVSMSVLYWIELNMVNLEFSTTDIYYGIPSYLDLARTIVQLHSFQRPKVLDLLSKILERSTGLNPISDLEVKKTFIDTLIFLIHCGHVLPSLEMIHKWASTTDQSLVRYFILQLLDGIEPPFSYPFISAIFKILERSQTMEVMKNVDKRAVMINFIEYCLKEKFNWTEKEKVCLNQLQEFFLVK